MQDTAVVTLDSLGFKVASYQKSDQSIFGPRFGSGSQSETDLTLLKAATFHSGDSGSFGGKVGDLSPYLISGLNYSPIGYLKKTCTATAIQTLTLGGTTYRVRPTAEVFWQGEVVLAVRIDNGGASVANKLYKYNSGGGAGTEITLPAALRDSAQPITSLTPWNGSLMITSPVANGLWVLEPTLTTVTAVTLAGTIKQMFMLNQKLYFWGTDNAIYEYTGTISAATFTLITATQKTVTTDTTIYSIATLNGRAYFAFANVGLWCFDGVRAYEVLNSSSSGSQSNFGFVCAANGYLYTNKGTSLYRFNGSSVERIFDLPSDTLIIKAVEKDGKLFFLTNTGAGTYTDNIKGNLDSGTYGYRLFEYDGENIYQIFDYRLTTANTVYNTWTVISPSWFGLSVVVGLEYAAMTSNSIYVTNYNLSGDSYYESALASVISFQDTDFNLPSINKKMSSCQFIFQKTLGLIAGSKTLKVYYRLDETASWTLCKTFSGVDSQIYVGDFDVDIPACKRIFFKCDLDGSNLQFTRFSVYYLVIPPLKYQWNLLLNPATNTLEAPSAYDNTFFAKLAALRTAGTKFAYVDLNNVSYNVIVDSFVQKIDPTYSGTSNNYESQFSVVLREV